MRKEILTEKQDQRFFIQYDEKLDGENFNSFSLTNGVTELLSADVYFDGHICGMVNSQEFLFRSRKDAEFYFKLFDIFYNTSLSILGGMVIGVPRDTTIIKPIIIQDEKPMFMISISRGDEPQTNFIVNKVLAWDENNRPTKSIKYLTGFERDQKTNSYANDYWIEMCEDIMAEDIKLHDQLFQVLPWVNKLLKQEV